MDADPEFGQVVFLQKINKSAMGNAVFLMLLGILPALVVLAPTPPISMRVGFFVFGLGFIAFALVMIWRNWMHVVLQQRGIREYRQGHERSLSFDQVDELTYSSLRILMNGSYIHTVEKLALKNNQAQGPPLVCTRIFRVSNPTSAAEAPSPLCDARNTIAAVLAERMMERLNANESVAWTHNLCLRRGGLEFTDRDGGTELFEWRRISQLAVQPGKLQVWVDARTVPLAEMPTNQTNFYPAYLVVSRLTAR